MVVGSFAFLAGVGVLFALFELTDDDPETRLFELNAALSTAIVFLALGGFLTVSAASALGKTSSTPLRVSRWWALVVAPFPLLVLAGQYLANDPERAPWLFPFVNVAMVSAPSVGIALMVTSRYLAMNPIAWPVSKREWTSGFIYGAVGATTVGAIINTAYLLLTGLLLVETVGPEYSFGFESDLRNLPREWGIFLDLSVLSLVAPLNEEFWKGMLVAFFFFRRGGLARCYLWGVLAGAGFNLLETFSNSLAAVSPDALADETIGSQWWFFALARTGTAAMHAAATGFAAIGFYGLFRKKKRYLWGLVAGPFLHGSWNFLVYAIWGDAFLTGAGPDSGLLDVLGGVGLLVLFASSLLLLWTLPSRLRDERPAPIYQLIGMSPAGVALPIPKPPPPPAAFGVWAEAAGGPLLTYSHASTSGRGPDGTLTTSALGSTEKDIGVSPA